MRSQQLEGHLAMYGQGPHHLSAEMEQQRAHELAHAYARQSQRQHMEGEVYLCLYLHDISGHETCSRHAVRYDEYDSPSK
jgi:hypothetical protein